MAQLTIVTTPTNSGDGTPLSTAFNYCNSNFSELYSRVQTAPPATLVGQVGDTAGMYAYDESFFYYCFADYDGSTVIWGEIAQAGNISVTSIQRGNSNVVIADLGSNVTVGVGGVSNIAVFTTTGQQVVGAVSATGNVTGSFILGNGSQLTGLPATYANSNVAAYLLTNTGNIAAGNISATGNVAGGNIITAGNISTAGTVAAAGTISATGNIVTTGLFVGNFQGNVTGNFVIPGANTQVVFNTNGNADAVAGMTFDTNGPNLFTVLGTISSQGNVVAGNITTAGLITATGNITGGNIRTAGVVTATGNITGGNILTAGIISSTANITGGNILTAGIISSTANITGGNMRTAGAVTATGNVSGGNVLVTNDIQAGGNVSATTHTGTSVSVTGNVTGGNLRTAGVISATGNISGNYFIGNGSQLSNVNINNISNGNSNVLISSSGGNVSINVTGVSPVALFTPVGVTVEGNVSATGNILAPAIVGGTVTGSSASVTGNVTGANVNTGGQVIATGNVTGGNLTTAGQVTAAGNVTGGNVTTAGLITATGNVTGGNLSVGTGRIAVGNIVNGNGNGVGNIGNASTYFNTVFAKATSAQYADLAENYVADEDYAPGTVVVFGGNAEISISREAGDERVAGVISTQPAHLMNAGQPGLPVALRGRVPVMVIGPVFKGDSLVTSSTSGHAQSVGRDRSYGQAVFAKALETNTSPGEKIITAVIL
jgi:hypothetical protein